MKKIYIIGSGGSGKTTLAMAVAKGFSLPHLELDDIYWDNEQKKAYNIKRSEEARTALLTDFLKKNKTGWVIEGVYEKEWIEPILKEADLVIVLMTSFWLSEWRCIKRNFVNWLNGKRTGGLLSLYRLLKWNHKYRYQKLPLFIEKLKEEKIPFQIIDRCHLNQIKETLSLENP